MMLHIRMKHVMVPLVLTLVLLAGCSKGTSGEPKPEGTTTDQSPKFETVAPPGIYDLPNGTTQALGILAHRDVEGGFWAVVKTAVPEQAATAEVVAVIVPPEGVDLATMNGQFVSAIGARQSGPSVFMAGPVLLATQVDVVTEHVAK